MPRLPDICRVKIIHLRHHEIDKHRWDACVHEAFNGLIYGWSWYLDEVCESWDALVNEDYTAVMPLPWKRKWGMQYIYQPFFCQQLGVFSVNQVDESLIKEFLRHIPSSFRKIHLQLNSQVNFTIGCKDISWRSNYRLSLAGNYTLLSKKYSVNHQRNIKRALKAKYKIREQETPQAIIALYMKYYAGRTPELKPEDYRTFQKLTNEALERDMLFSIAAYDEQDQLAAGAIFFRGPRYLYYMMGASTDKDKDNGIMHHLMDEAIRKFSDTNLVLDFEGSENEGIARFFSGFGASRVPYYVYRKKFFGLL